MEIAHRVVAFVKNAPTKTTDNQRIKSSVHNNVQANKFILLMVTPLSPSNVSPRDLYDAKKTKGE